jgi:hypothetical protein
LECDIPALGTLYRRVGPPLVARTRESESSGSDTSSSLEQEKSEKEVFKGSEASSTVDVKDTGATVEQAMHNGHHDAIVLKKGHCKELISYLSTWNHLQVLRLRLDCSQSALPLWNQCTYTLLSFVKEVLMWLLG